MKILDISSTDLGVNRQDLRSALTNQEIQGVIHAPTFGNNEDHSGLFDEIKSMSNAIIVNDLCLSAPILNPNPHGHCDVELYSTGYSKYVDLGYGGYAWIDSRFHYTDQIQDFNKTHENELDQMFRNAVFSGSSIDLDMISEYNWLSPLSLESSDYWTQITSKLDKVHKHKSSINAIYKELIPIENQLPDTMHQWRFQVHINNKTDFLESLSKENLFASSHYFPLGKLFGEESSKEEWDQLFSRTVNLFNDFRYTPEMAKRTSELILRYC